MTSATEMATAMESPNSGCPSGKATDMSFSELAPKVAPPDSLEEDDETCVDSGSSNHGDETFIDSGSSSNGEEEVTWNCASEEEKAAVSAGVCASSQQPLHLEDALESKETKQPPTRTKLSSNALVFIPGAPAAAVAPTSASGMKSVQAGRELLSLLKKGNSTSEVPSDTQEKPKLRSKLSSKAQSFVPQGNTKLTSNSQAFVPQVMQTTGFTPVVQLLPTMLIPMMCTQNDGFDDSPQATPRATHPAEQPEMPNVPDLSIRHEHPTGSIQQPVDSEQVVLKSPPKLCWADLYEDEEDDISNDLWLDASAKNEVLSLS